MTVLLTSDFASAEEKSKFTDGHGPTRKLWGTAYSEACAARSRADLMRADLESRIPPGNNRRTGARQSPKKPDPFEKDVAEVVRAYRNVIDRYPHTEIAAYCATRLAGLYQHRGEYELAAELLEKTAAEFAGTREGVSLAFESGLVHAQALDDPEEAGNWFASVPSPANGVDPAPEDARRLYLTAQEQLVKGDLKLGHAERARSRIDQLKKDLPQYAHELDRFLQFELGSNGLPFDAAQSPPELEVRPRTPRLAYLLLGNLLIAIGFTTLVVILRKLKHKGEGR
jgi:tetratricopeptide (TPR) repeat protein